MSEKRRWRVELTRRVVQYQTAVVYVTAPDEDAARCEVLDTFDQDGTELTWRDGAENVGDFDIDHVEEGE